MITRDGYNAAGQVIREYIGHDGTVLAETFLRPTVLPMTSMSFRHIERAIYVKSLTKLDAYPKGSIFRLLEISAKGVCVIIHVDWEGHAANTALPEAYERAVTMDKLVELVEDAVELPSPTPLLDTMDQPERIRHPKKPKPE